jgi:hypothetical protein
MKSSCLLPALAFLLAALAHADAQNLKRPALENNPKPGESVIVERGAHHRVWKQARLATRHGGQLVTNVSSYTELGSGLHRWDEQQEKWVDAEAKIEIVGNSALGRSAAHQVAFAGNANTAGAIDFLTPDGKRLRSHVLGIAFFDAATGQSEMIGELKDSAGELHAPNVVIYPEAFDGLKADLRYTYRLGGFEQDVILYENPPLPQGFGPETRLEVWTEFIEAPASTIRQKARAGMTDDTLDFGAMQTAASKVFALGMEPESQSSAPAAKRWLTTEGGRTFLIEAVRLQSVQRELEKLPAGKGHARANPPPPRNGPLDRVFPSAPPVRQARQDGRQQKFKLAVVEKAPAKLAQVRPALVLDYNLTASLTNYTLKSDTTYVVSNAVNFYETTTVEGGCVVKVAKTNVAGLVFQGPVVWDTDLYRPAVFTAVDDHSVGESIGSGALSGYYGGTYLQFQAANGDPTHFRVSHARTGLSASTYNPTIRHAQFVQCSNSLALDFSATAQVNLQNALFTDVHSVFDGQCLFSGAHLTVHRCTNFYAGNATPTVNLLNSLVVHLGSWGDTEPTLTSCHTGSVSTIFQTVGAAAHYLAADSIHRNAGTTTGLSAGLLADLKKLTTYPPVVITGMVASDLTLLPQAQRDADVPDRGYHYPPLDYALGHAGISNATLIATGGVALATYAPSYAAYGIGVIGSAQLHVEGSPANLNRIVRYNTVQEQANTNWSAAPGPQFKNVTGTHARFRFTEFAVLAQDTDHIRGDETGGGTFLIRDCQFAGGRNNSAYPDVYYTNCLFRRVNNELTPTDNYISASYDGCLFRGGRLYLANDGGFVTAELHNNLFDETLVETNWVDTVNSHNAYTTNVARLTPFSSSSVVLSLTNIPFVAGPLGNYYLPTNGVATNLFNAGSTNAHLLGFYHYTTTTNQAKEGTSWLDIGFHYIAVNASGQPIDTDADGLPDYLEDANGDGVLDHRETKIADASDPGLRVFITKPRDGGTIP